jgi:hypothetical protein
MLSGRGICDGLITRPEESNRLWCVVVCDLETSKMRRLKLATGLWKIQPNGCNAKKQQQTTTRSRLVVGYWRFEATFRYPSPFGLTQCDYWSPGKSENNVYKNNTCTDNNLKGMLRRAMSAFVRQELATVLVTFSLGVKHVWKLWVVICNTWFNRRYFLLYP